MNVKAYLYLSNIRKIKRRNIHDMRMYVGHLQQHDAIGFRLIFFIFFVLIPEHTKWELMVNYY